MLISLVSHFKLRSIPWNALYHNVLLVWEAMLGSKGPSHCDVEILELKQRADNEMPDYTGYIRRAPYGNGGHLDIRLFTKRESDHVSADLFTTFDTEHFETFPFVPYYLLTTLAAEYTPLGKLHLGHLPDVVYTTTEIQMNRRHIYKAYSTRLEWACLYNKPAEESPSAEQPETEAASETPVEKTAEQPQETPKEDVPVEAPAEMKEEPLPPKVEEPRETESESVTELREKILALTESLEDALEKNRRLKSSQKDLLERIRDQKKKIDYQKKLFKKKEELVKDTSNNAYEKFCEAFDGENEKLTAEIDRLTQANQEQQQTITINNAEIKTLKSRLKKMAQGNGSAQSLLDFPQGEIEKIEDEFGIAIMAALHHAIDSTPTKTNSPKIRSIDVWAAFIKANPLLEQDFRDYCKKRDALLNAMKRNDLDRNHGLLEPLGLKFSTHMNNHGKINFADDDGRYQGTVASTPSENASGPSNSAADLKHAFLY